MTKLEKYLRERVGELKPLTTFSQKWSEFDSEQLWPKRKLLQPPPRRSSEAKRSSNTTEDERLLVRLFGSSNMFDRLLALLFVLFWLYLSGWGVFLLSYLLPR